MIVHIIEVIYVRVSLNYNVLIVVLQCHILSDTSTLSAKTFEWGVRIKTYKSKSRNYFWMEDKLYSI